MTVAKNRIYIAVLSNVTGKLIMVSASDAGWVLSAVALPERFDAAGFITEQKFATAKDGTHIPYFMVRPKDLEFDGQRPTLLYAYGGFENSSTPGYTFPIGNSPNMTSWLEAGGTLVVANICGGGSSGRNGTRQR